MNKPLTNPFIEDLHSILGDRLSTVTAVCEQHGQDESYHPSHPPDAVAFAQSTEEVSQLVQVCQRHKKPIIPFGTGTSLEGHVAALHGGLCIDLTAMNQILEVNVNDLDCRVQAGVTRKTLNHYLRDTGLFFSVDPGADASIGGMTATRATGTNTVRYGGMRENVMGLTVVLADGKIIQTGTRARKSSAGYDLTRLFCGSEGTLGVITEIQLRLYGVPEAISAAVCSFPTLEGAINTVIPTIQLGIPVARVELLDELQMDAVNQFSNLDYPLQPTLFFEFHGTEQSVSEQAEMVSEIAMEQGGSDFRWGTQQEERNKLWQARHDAYYAALALKPDSKGVVTDICVPISRLSECILETKKDLETSGLMATVLGHVGDGNFHLVFPAYTENKNEMEQIQIVHHRLVMRALEMGGTCTAEHGIGYGKLQYMEAEHGEAVSVMASIKQALDPMNLMNPGKLIPKGMRTL